MKLNNGVAEGTLHNPMFLVLVMCTIISPVMPGVALAVIAAVTWWKRRGELHEFDLVSVILLALTAVAVVATFIQQTPWGFVSIFAFVMYFWVYNWFKKSVSHAQFYNGLSVMGVTGAAIVLIMLVNRAGGFDFLPATLQYFFGLESWKPTDSLRSTGTSGNANLAAGLLVCLALISFYKIIVPGRLFLRRRALWAGLFALYMVGFELTGTRMAWIALSFGVAVQLWFLHGRRVREHVRQFHFSNLFIFFAAAALLLLVNKEWLPRQASFNTDLSLRLQIWERALHLFQHDWMFGVLPLHFGEVFKAHYGQYEFHAHNLWIGFAVDFGILGFALFMLLLITSLRRGIQWIRWAETECDRGLAIMLLSIVFAFFGQGLADYTVLVPQTGWLFLMSLGYIHIRWLQLAPLKQPQNEQHKFTHSTRKVNPLPK
mgnify:CR=1 FL=1